MIHGFPIDYQNYNYIVLGPNVTICFRIDKQNNYEIDLGPKVTYGPLIDIEKRK